MRRRDNISAVIRPDNPSVVLAVYDAPFAFDELPFVNVSRLFAQHSPAGSRDRRPCRRSRHPHPRRSRRCHASGPSRRDAADRARRALQASGRARLSHAAARAAELESPEFLPYGIAFDRDKLMWELNFFVKHFLEAYRGARHRRRRSARRARRGVATLADELPNEPRVLCHRDYHSRNLMLHSGGSTSSTFRTRAWGLTPTTSPRLLRDSYVDVAEERVDELIRGFLRSAAPRTRPPRPSSNFAAASTHVAAAQPESARHIRPSDHGAQQPRLHPIHSAHAELRAHATWSDIRASRRLRELLGSLMMTD